MMVKPKAGGGRFKVHSKPSLCIPMNSSCCGLLCMWRFFQTTRAHRLHPRVFRELLREVDGLVDGHRSSLPQMGGSQHRTTQRTRSTSWKVLLCCLSYLTHTQVRLALLLAGVESCSTAYICVLHFASGSDPVSERSLPVLLNNKPAGLPTRPLSGVVGGWGRMGRYRWIITHSSCPRMSQLGFVGWVFIILNVVAMSWIKDAHRILKRKKILANELWTTDPLNSSPFLVWNLFCLLF